ncbi:MAG TPA: hypothetical protein VNI20_06605 [Fimbriimonadaceae bacterium]|nr:hypothetical protein [Fimbriimonadaceae bacterium]
MLATLALLGFATTAPAIDGVKFSYKTALDETTNYIVDITGDSDEGEVKIALEFSMKVKEMKEGGPATYELHVDKASISQGGQEVPGSDLGNMSVDLDQHGVPTELDLNGLQSVFYIFLLTQYLPDQELSAGDGFQIDLKYKMAVYQGNGSFSGTEELEGKQYPVIKTKCQLVPSNDQGGEIAAKKFFDPASGKVVRTEATIDTPDGEFKLTAKPKS